MRVHLADDDWDIACGEEEPNEFTKNTATVTCVDCLEEKIREHQRELRFLCAYRDEVKEMKE